MDSVIQGIVLAAGRSRRMGRPKALLPAAGATFLQRAVEALRAGGCTAVWVAVSPPEADPAAREIAEAARSYGAGVAVNPPGELEQIDSLRTALRALGPAAEAAVVTPVDLPRIEPEVVRALIDAFRARRAPVVVPAYRGEHGHPVLFSREVFPELLADPLPEGARSVVHAHRADLVEVPVADAAVLLDVNTPADYQRVLEAGV